MSGLCGDVLRLYVDPEGLLPPPDYSAGWLYDAGRGRKAHYFPRGTAPSACWRWERPETWPPVATAPHGPACARCYRRWRRERAA